MIHSKAHIKATFCLIAIPSGLFSFIFGLFKQQCNLTILHLVCRDGIRTHDLFIILTTITTRPGLPPFTYLFEQQTLNF